MKELRLEEIGITLYVDDAFSKEDVVVNTEHDLFQFGVRKAGIRKMEVHTERQIQLVFGNASNSTVEEIDARGTTADLQPKISAWLAQTDATRLRTSLEPADCLSNYDGHCGQRCGLALSKKR